MNKRNQIIGFVSVQKKGILELDTILSLWKKSINKKPSMLQRKKDVAWHRNEYNKVLKYLNKSRK